MRTHEIVGPEVTQVTGQLRIPNETAIRKHIAQFWLWGELRDSKKRKNRKKVQKVPIQQENQPVVAVIKPETEQQQDPKPSTSQIHHGTWSGWD